jgi:hypothetical protein
LKQETVMSLIEPATSLHFVKGMLGIKGTNQSPSNLVNGITGLFNKKK